MVTPPHPPGLCVGQHLLLLHTEQVKGAVPKIRPQPLPTVATVPSLGESLSYHSGQEEETSHGHLPAKP